ncbi:MAG: hypothetical protein SOR77_00735 [Peptoniphilus sp.]|uniref:hypothetical protein n=1 Tax=Peptoniphilus sp. TaxID=1971214 RepID=UPI002A75D272|nr:hypothetical protein [Peptoniphilus sp.]MDY2986135.1 hypothetical protein [Peptoniphilus sp.]
MEKVIEINGRQVAFKANAAFPLVYKNQFGKDILTIIMPIISELLKGADELMAKKETIKASDLGALLENVYALELNDILSLIWTMAKIADPNIKEPLVWFSEFEEFPIFDVAKELLTILIPSLVTKKKLTKIMEAIKTK